VQEVRLADKNISNSRQKRGGAVGIHCICMYKTKNNRATLHCTHKRKKRRNILHILHCTYNTREGWQEYLALYTRGRDNINILYSTQKYGWQKYTVQYIRGKGGRNIL
jgi:hypothetical protein